LDSWSPIPDLVGIERWHAFAFSLSSGKGSPTEEGYIGGGSSTLFPNPTMLADFWCYCPTTAINETNSVNNIVLYPTPSSNFIVIDGLPYKKNIISIYDLSGKVVLNSQINNQKPEIELTQLPKGNYIYEIVSESVRLKAGKLVIQ
jgi:hypothetical protein